MSSPPQSTNGFELKSTNPKDGIGIRKVPLSLVPKTALIHQAMAHRDGAIKYGRCNWREEGVSASVYVDAHDRHLALWFDASEENAPDSKVHHLGHAIACLNIILDSQECGNLVDDRPIPAPVADILERYRQKEDAEGSEVVDKTRAMFEAEELFRETLEYDKKNGLAHSPAVCLWLDAYTKGGAVNDGCKP